MDALRRDKIVFPNDENVKFLSSPLLIIHGENDKTVPLECGKKLYEIAHNAYRNKERVKMVIFPPGFQHNFLCKSPILLKTVRDFLSQQWAWGVRAAEGEDLVQTSSVMCIFYIKIVLRCLGELQSLTFPQVTAILVRDSRDAGHYRTFSFSLSEFTLWKVLKRHCGESEFGKDWIPSKNV